MRRERRAEARLLLACAIDDAAGHWDSRPRGVGRHHQVAAHSLGGDLVPVVHVEPVAELDPLLVAHKLEPHLLEASLVEHLARRAEPAGERVCERAPWLYW
eukprot:3379195-Prymnesium_polylepis.1